MNFDQNMMGSTIFDSPQLATSISSPQHHVHRNETSESLTPSSSSISSRINYIHIDHNYSCLVLSPNLGRRIDELDTGKCNLVEVKTGDVSRIVNTSPFMKNGSNASISSPIDICKESESQGSVSQRSQRRRRKPKRWDDEESTSELASDHLNNTSLNKENEKQDEDESEDDPNKLWCVCRQPHNNRFMICCDGCEEWFHGKCVGISRVKGTALGKQGIKWYCANCQKKKEAVDVKTPVMMEIKQEPVDSPPPLEKSMDQIKSESLSPKPTASSSVPHSSVTSPSASVPSHTSPTIGSSKKAIKHKSNDSNDCRKILSKRIRNEKDMKIGDVLKQRKLKEAGSKAASIERKDANRLRKLIKSSRMDMKKKMDKLGKASQKQQQSQQTPEADKQENKWEPISKVVPLTRKVEEKKKKFKNTPVDPSFQDLFKAEPIMMSKKITPTTYGSNPSTPTGPPAKRPSISGNTQQRKPSGDRHCISCTKQVQKGAIGEKELSIYCSESCLERRVKESLDFVKQSKAQTPGHNGGKSTKIRVGLVDRISGRILSGEDSLHEDKVLEYIKANPTFDVMKPNSIRRQSSQSSDLDQKRKDLIKGAPNQAKTPIVKRKDDVASTTQRQKSIESSVTKPELKREESSDFEVRLNVKAKLKETLQQRCQEADSKMLVDEIEAIANKIEEELFIYFNKDISHKYRTKFRSLIFNLKDPKNQGLFRKVLTGSISPERLVRMTPDELASSELAKWRERETKHAIEMIKRDAEAMSQQVIVKKTHKGEEVIETKATLETLDPVTEEEPAKTTPKPLVSTASTPASSAPPKDKPFFGALEILGETFKDERGRDEDNTDKHGQHLYDLHCKICTNQTKEIKQDPSLTHFRTKTQSPLNAGDTKLSQPKRVRVEFDDTTKIYEKALKLSESHRKPSESIGNEASEGTHLSSIFSPSNLETEQVKPKSPPSCWRGFIHMQDVTKFFALAYRVHGLHDNKLKDMPDSITVCGRIAPEQALNYLKQISSQDMAVIKFVPATREERRGYDDFFQYLFQRKRYAVVGPQNKYVKDFYILPLPRDVEPPEQILPFDGPGLETSRRNLLIGVLVRNRKHSSKALSKEKASSLDSAKFESASTSLKDQPERSYTPPPPTETSTSNDAVNEEPYDPGLSLTPPPPVETQPQEKTLNESEEPYDPEENDLVGDIPTTSEPSESKINISELLEQFSQSNDPIESATSDFSSLATNAFPEDKKLLLEELTKKVEDSKRQLEEQKKAAEAVFSIAAKSIDIGRNDAIPGLDGSYPNDG